MTGGREQRLPDCPGCGVATHAREGRLVTWGCGTNSDNVVLDTEGRFRGAYRASAYCKQVQVDRMIADRARDYFTQHEYAAEANHDETRARESLLMVVRRGS